MAPFAALISHMAVILNKLGQISLGPRPCQVAVRAASAVGGGEGHWIPTHLLLPSPQGLHGDPILPLPLAGSRQTPGNPVCPAPPAALPFSLEGRSKRHVHPRLPRAGPQSLQLLPHCSHPQTECFVPLASGSGALCWPREDCLCLPSPATGLPGTRVELGEADW